MKIYILAVSLETMNGATAEHVFMGKELDDSGSIIPSRLPSQCISV